MAKAPNKLPKLPIWVTDYLADTGHLSLEEHGAYLRLIMLCWQTSGCRIPNDVVWLKRKLGVSEKEFKSSVQPIIKEFFNTTGNFIFQKRLKREFAAALKISKGATVSAKSRWDKDKSSETASNPHTDRNASNSKSKSNKNSNGLGNKRGTDKIEHFLKDKTRENIKTVIARGYDFNNLCNAFDEFNNNDFSKLKSIEGAFKAFCKTHVERNPL